MISNLKKNTGVNWFNPKDIGLSIRDAQCYARGAFFEDSSIAQLIEIKKCLMNVTKERVFFLNNEVQFIHDLP